MDTQPNYFEFHLFCTPISDSQYKTDAGKARFDAALRALSKRNIKHFQRLYKEYKYGNTVFHNHANEEAHVFRTTPFKTSYADGVLEVAYQKQKLSIINVPASAAVDDVLYVKHLVFKVSNRTFVNAVVKRNMGGLDTFHVYINYNHDPNVDTTVAEKQLADTFQLFGLTKRAPTC